MTRFFGRKKTKQIVCIILTVLLLVGLVVGLYSLLSDKDTKKVHPLFSIGALDNNGKYKETKASIFTKNAFECQGLTITPDFECNVKYQIYFYDSIGVFVSKTDPTDKAYKDKVPLAATHARIVITPVEDDNISLFEIIKYARQLTIEVNKTQLSFVQMLNKQENLALIVGKGNANEQGDFASDDTSPFYVTNIIDVSNIDTIVIKLLTTSIDKLTPYAGGTHKNTQLYTYDTQNVNGTFTELTDYSILCVDGDISYIVVDVSNYLKLRVVTDNLSADILAVYAN